MYILSLTIPSIHIIFVGIIFFAIICLLHFLADKNDEATSTDSLQAFRKTSIGKFRKGKKNREKKYTHSKKTSKNRGTRNLNTRKFRKFRSTNPKIYTVVEQKIVPSAGAKEKKIDEAATNIPSESIPSEAQVNEPNITQKTSSEAQKTKTSRYDNVELYQKLETPKIENVASKTMRIPRLEESWTRSRGESIPSSKNEEPKERVYSSTIDATNRDVPSKVNSSFDFDKDLSAGEKGRGDSSRDFDSEKIKQTSTRRKDFIHSDVDELAKKTVKPGSTLSDRPELKQSSTTKRKLEKGDTDRKENGDKGTDRYSKSLERTQQNQNQEKYPEKNKAEDFSVRDILAQEEINESDFDKINKVIQDFEGIKEEVEGLLDSIPIDELAEERKKEKVFSEADKLISDAQWENLSKVREEAKRAQEKPISDEFKKEGLGLVAEITIPEVEKEKISDWKTYSLLKDAPAEKKHPVSETAGLWKKMLDP